MVTRKDVARRAGVAPCVVSYVINSSNYVSQEKREAVLKAVEELQYYPNYMAKSLKTKQTNNIAVISDDARNEYFSELLFAFEKYANERGYFVSLFSSHKRAIENLISFHVDGVFVHTPRLSVETLNQLASSGITVVLCNSVLYTDLHPKINHVTLDFKESMQTLTEFILEKGHRRIAYISSTQLDDPQRINLRYQGYLAALEKNNIRQDEALVAYTSDDMELVIKKVNEMLRISAPPTAVIAGNDSVAIKLMSYLIRQGYRVPEDIAVAGAGNIELSRYCMPALTTLEYGKERLSKAAVDNIIATRYGNPIKNEEFNILLEKRDSV